MLILPKSLKVERVEKAEVKLVEQTRQWLEKQNEERDERIHASALLDPLKAYWDTINPQPMSDKSVGLFFVGKVLHAFFLSALNGKEGVDWASDGGSAYAEELGIVYSPDWEKEGIPYEFKTSRFPSEQSTKDLGLYMEQLLIYMVCKGSRKGRLVVLQTNLKDSNGGGSYPQYRAYEVVLSQSDFDSYKAQVKKVATKLKKAIKTKNPKGLEICRPFKCGESNCPHWKKCRPKGRFGKKGWK